MSTDAMQDIRKTYFPRMAPRVDEELIDEA